MKSWFRCETPRSMIVYRQVMGTNYFDFILNCPLGRSSGVRLLLPTVEASCPTSLHRTGEATSRARLPTTIIAPVYLQHTMHEQLRSRHRLRVGEARAWLRLGVVRCN
jgi:hypothetical protein